MPCSAIHQILVERATLVQNEIVEAGRGSANIAEFYRQNHTWAEGLISAAKEVGWCVAWRPLIGY
jgi:hypothetical protein